MPTTAPAVSSETLLTKDQSLPINAPVSANPPVSPPSTPVPVASKPDFTPPDITSTAATVAPASQSSVQPLVNVQDITEPTVAPAPFDVPIVVTPQEVKTAEAGSEPTFSPVASQSSHPVEVLSGDIGSLRSKFNDSTAAPTPGTKPVTPAPLIVEPPKANPVTPSSAATSNPAVSTPPAPAPIQPVSSVPVVTTQPVSSAKPPEKSAVATFSDIFPKQAAKLNEKTTLPSNRANQTPGGSAADTRSPLTLLGEILAAFGALFLVVVLLGPFYQSLLDPSIYSTVKTLGLLVSVASLFIGWLVLLFSKGRVSLKILLPLLLLIAIVFYWGLNGSGPIADGINSLFGSVISLYH